MDCNAERDRLLRTPKLDFNSIISSFGLLTFLSPWLGLAAPVLFILKYAPVFTSGDDYHKPLRAAIFQVFHPNQQGDNERWPKLVATAKKAVKSAHSRHKPKLADVENLDPNVFKTVCDEVLNDVAAEWLIGVPHTLEEKQRLDDLVSIVTGLVADCANAGLIRAMHGMFYWKLAFIWEGLCFVFGCGNVCASLRSMQGMDKYMNSPWGRLCFVWMVLTGRGSDADEPLFKGMVALRDMNDLCLKWTKQPTEGSVIKAFRIELGVQLEDCSTEELDQMVASVVIFLLGALIRVTADQFLLLAETLFGDDSKLWSQFYEMLNTKLDTEHPTPLQALKVTTELGRYLREKTAVQTVERGGRRICMANVPFSVFGDLSDCAGKRIAVIILSEIFIVFKEELQAMSEAMEIALDSSSQLTDAFFRVDGIIRRQMA